MKKLILSSALLIVGLAATSAMAIPSEWLEINPTDTVADGTQAIGGTGPAYWLWTEDANRTIWNVAWTGGATSADLYSFTGTIQLENSTGDFTTFEFEYGGALGDELKVNGQVLGDGATLDGGLASIDAYATYGLDGFHLVLTDWTLPAYIGFDLKAVKVGESTPTDMSDRIYIGNTGDTVADLQIALGQSPDEDFRIAAPVPEPATMLLFGAGLAGLAGVNRRRKK